MERGKREKGNKEIRKKERGNPVFPFPFINFFQSPISNLQSPISNLHSPFSILLLTLPAWLPLLLDPGLINTRAGGDSPFLLQRVQQMSTALQGGHFPVRWMPDAAFGFGYPFWNYYAPLAFYVAAGLHLAGLGIVNAIKLTQILGFLLAAAGVYALVDDIFDSRPAAVLAAVAYTYAPFHLVNIYVRGDSLGEFVAFAFYPLILLGLRRLRAIPGPGPAAFTTLAYAGLILVHNISALIFTPFAIAYALWLLLSRTTHHAPLRRYLLWVGVAFALGLAVSAWYWAPALLEQDAVQLEGNLTGYFHYAGHFRSTNLVQRDLFFNFDVDAAGTPFAMGLVQASLGLIALLAIGTTTVLRYPKSAIRNPLFFAGTALAATFLITPWSQPLWDHVPLLPFVQFPWRWLSVQAFGLSVLIGTLAETQHATRNTQHATRWTLSAIFSLLLIITSMLHLHVKHLPVRDADVTADRLMLYEMFTGNIGSTVRAEYLPAAVNPRPWVSDALMQGEQALPIGATSAQRLDRGPVSQQWQITVDQPRDVVFPTYWFPGWRATVDGQPAETSAQPNHGGIRVPLPAGTHQVRLILGRTLTRRLAELISAAGVLLLFALLVRCGLTRVDLRRGAAGVTVVVIVGLALGVAASLAEPINGPLTMDFSHMPYLHPNPGGVRLADGLQLLRYELNATELEAGQTVDIEMIWDELPPEVEVEAALVSPAEVLFDVPAVIAETQVPNPKSETCAEPCRSIRNPKPVLSPAEVSEILLHVPDSTTAGLYLPRLRIVKNSEKPSGRSVNDGQKSVKRSPNRAKISVLYLQPIRIRPIILGRNRVVGRFADVVDLGPVATRQLSPERLEVSLTWWAEHPISANYATSVRLKNTTGETIVQVDTQPCYGFCPTSLWEAGVPVYDRRWLELPAGTPPGENYYLEIVLYERASLTPIDTLQINNIALTQLPIKRDNGE